MKRNMSGNGSKVLVIRIVCAILCDHFMEIIVVRIYPLDGGGSEKGSPNDHYSLLTLRFCGSMKFPCSYSCRCDKYRKF